MEMQNMGPEAVICAKVNVNADDMTFNDWRQRYVWTSMELYIVVAKVSFVGRTFTVVVVPTKCCARRPADGWLPLSEEFLHLTRSRRWNTQQQSFKSKNMNFFM